MFPESKKLASQVVTVLLDIIMSIELAVVKLEELHVVYTLDTMQELKDLTENLSVKKLVLSGDLIKDKESKEYINSLRKSGIKVEVVGPII